MSTKCRCSRGARLPSSDCPEGRRLQRNPKRKGNPGSDYSDLHITMSKLPVADLHAGYGDVRVRPADQASVTRTKLALEGSSPRAGGAISTFNVPQSKGRLRLSA